MKRSSIASLPRQGRYVLIGHERFGASGKRVFGLIPQMLRLMFLARFVEQLRGPGSPLPEKKEAIALLKQLLEAGTITPIIDRTYPLSRAREAFRRKIEDETLGKIIITPDRAV